MLYYLLFCILAGAGLSLTARRERSKSAPGRAQGNPNAQRSVGLVGALPTGAVRRGCAAGAVFGSAAVTDWKRVKRAAERAEADLAVQGWLCVLIAVAALLASLTVI